MNKRTSWPWSRKYSAIVSPERPTRRRAPGGSFICPNTSATLSMTPDSSISRRRSLPSRDLSPTPVKTETPPCCIATLWMSSWIRTVLPRPAPPKNPTLPPFTKGAMRSMTFRPVSKISSFGERSRKLGGSRWIGHRSTSPLGGGFSSIGSPVTFQSRPSVASPTGTEIGPSVSTTTAPRGRPSVESIATARTRSSPRCCWTSATSVPTDPSGRVTSISSAVLISGSRSENTASITTPLISMILPVFLPWFAVLPSSDMRLLSRANSSAGGRRRG